MDITMTAVLRPEVLQTTLASFNKNLFGDISNHRLIINIDPVGGVKVQDVLDVIYKFFRKDMVVYNTPKEPHFGKAAKWCWERIESKYVFHLEDDWELVRKVEMDDLIGILNNNPDIASVRLLIYKSRYMKGHFKNTKSKYFIMNDTLTLNPCLYRGEFLKGLSKIMNPNLNPELQVVTAKSNSDIGKYRCKWHYAVYDHKNNPIVKNIGKDWRIARNLIRAKSGFVTWTEIDGI